VTENQFQVIDIDGGKMLACPEFFDISVVAEFHQVLVNLLVEKPDAITFDVANVEIIDTSILQSACAFMHDAEKEGIVVEWKNASESVCQSAQTLGLDRFLKLAC